MNFSVTRNDALRQYAAEGLRPQTLIFTLLGRHLLDRDVALASSTFIAALESLGISVQATRSTLNRMVRRGHLTRHRVGRKAYFAISDSLKSVLKEGEERIFEAPMREMPEDVWTLLSFSIPEEQRSDRHSLRTALSWIGFGPLRNGLWIAPGEVDPTPIVERLGLHEQIEVFTAEPATPTDMQRVVRETWDLGLIAKEYRDFLDRWADDDPPGGDDAFAARILIITEWQQILVDDPELPLRYLPRDWPAMSAYSRFRQLHASLSPEATAAFARIEDSIPMSELPEGSLSGGQS